MHLLSRSLLHMCGASAGFMTGCLAIVAGQEADLEVQMAPVRANGGHAQEQDLGALLDRQLENAAHSRAVAELCQARERVQQIQAQPGLVGGARGCLPLQPLHWSLRSQVPMSSPSRSCQACSFCMSSSALPS